MPFDITLYIIFSVVLAIISFFIGKAILQNRKIKADKSSALSLSKEERSSLKQKENENKIIEKSELREAIKQKKQQWREEDAKNIAHAREQLSALNEEKTAKTAELLTAKQRFQEQPDNKETRDHYYQLNKDYDRICQKIRIEKSRISLGRRFDNWSKRGGRLRRELFIKRQYYYLVAPYTLLFFIFTVVPVLMSLYLSFTNFNLLEFPKWIGWENYMRLFVDDKVFIVAIRNTLVLAVVTGPLSYIAAFLFAWLINELKPLLRSFMTLIFYAPSISGNVYLVWKLIFASDRYGYANSFLLQYNIINEPILWLTTETYIIWIIMLVQLWLSLGVSFLAFIAGLQSVDKTLYEAGAIDGIRNRWQELWHITLPQMKSQLMFGAVMQITSSLSVAEVATQIAGFPSVNYAGHTIVTHLMDYGSIRMEMGYASAIATVLFLAMILVNILIRKILRRVGS